MISLFDNSCGPTCKGKARGRVRAHPHRPGALLGEGEPEEAVAAFEAWFEARTGASFRAPLDQPVQDTPVVDF